MAGGATSKVLDLTLVAAANMEATINAAIALLEAADWIVYSQTILHIVDAATGNPKLLYFLAAQKQEIV